MKKLILTCALLTSASMLSFAQSTQSSVTMTPQSNAAAPQTNAAPPQTAPQPAMRQQQMQPEQMAKRRADIYQKQYALNDEQYKGVYNAELDFMKQMMDMRSNGQQPSAEQNQKLMVEKDNKFKAAMSPDQYAKYSATRSPQTMKQPATATPAPAGK